MLNKESMRGQLVTRRTFIIGTGKLSLLFLLAGKMFYMQFIKKDKYKTLSDKNRIKIIIIPPLRGQIYDINKNIIVKNNICFRLLLDKNIDNKFNNELLAIFNLLELDSDQIKEIDNRIKYGGNRIPIIIIDCLDWQQISTIEERRPDLKSIFIDTGYIRFYKYGPSLAHVIGYMGGRGKIKNLHENNSLIDENCKIGKTGIEGFYENTLRGEFGYKQIEVNAYDKYVRTLVQNNSITGEDLYLNIDAEINNKILPMLSPQGCSAVVMDCNNGGILIYSSSPSFEPNYFNKLSQNYWNDLLNNTYNPLIDQITKSHNPPGSVFKIITILAALEANITTNYRVTCTGEPMLGGNSFRCASRRGHGNIDMFHAITHSCNTYIFDIAKKIGADKILDMANRFGFGSKTGVDLPDELSGFLPSREWKRRRLKSKWSLGDTFNLSIGQGFLLSTTLQLARFIAAIGSNGKLFTPRIKINEPFFTQINIKQEYLDIVKLALHQTVNNYGGTGYSGRLNNYGMYMAGKTGTAQVQAKKNADDDLSHANIAWHRRNHAIFIGYAPSENPKYAISVYFNHGGSGGRSAAPIARDIMQEVLAKYF